MLRQVAEGLRAVPADVFREAADAVCTGQPLAFEPTAEHRDLVRRIQSGAKPGCLQFLRTTGDLLRAAQYYDLAGETKKAGEFHCRYHAALVRDRFGERGKKKDAEPKKGGRLRRFLRLIFENSPTGGRDAAEMAMMAEAYRNRESAAGKRRVNSPFNRGRVLEFRKPR